MSNAVMNLCWPLRMPPTAKAVLVSMADQADDNGYCWPSIAKISERTCFSLRSVIDALKWLENSRAIVADRSNGRHTKYTLVPGDFQPTADRSPRTKIRDSNAAAQVEPVQMPHGSEEPTHADAARVPVQMPHEPVQMPHTNHQEPPYEPPITIKVLDTPLDLVAGFETFYAAYPRKKARAAGLKAWQKLKPDGQLQTRILAAVAVQRRSEEWVREGGRFVPYPATYLNQERWADEVSESVRAAAGAGTPWFKLAGFLSADHARNFRCFEHNAHQFRGGERIHDEVAA